MNAGRALTRAGLDSDELRAALHPIQPSRLTLKPASPLMMKLWGQGIQAITIRGWIFVDPRYLNGDPTKLGKLVVHELVHARQWADLGFFGFLGRYLRDYVNGRRRGRSHREAYMEIGLEVEARKIQARLT